MTENEEGAPELEARKRATALMLAGRLKIEIAGVAVGHVEIPDDIAPDALSQHIRFEFPGAEG